MSSYQRSSLAVVLVLLITFCGTFLVSEWTRSVVRIDTTQAGVYSLSEGSERIIDGLQKPLTMKFFYSKALVDQLALDRLRELNNYYYYVRDLLRTYARYSGGKLKLEEYDPKAFSDAETEADRLGVRRFPGFENTGFYFGLAVTSESGAEEVVEVFDPSNQGQVEYQVSEAIELATKPKKKKLGVLSSLDITGGGMTDMMRQMMQMQGRPVTQPWGVVEMLRRFYEVSDVQADAEEIDPEIDYLLVVHPKNLTDGTLYAIDQFVMRGGKLVAAVDPFAPIADPAPQDPQNPYGGMSHDSSSDLNRLLEAWGVRVAKDRFVGDPNLMQAVPTRRGRSTLAAFLDLNANSGAGVNPDEPVARGLGNRLLAYFPGAVEATATAPEGATFVPFLRTTPEGNTFTAERFELAAPGGPDPQRINEKFKPGVSPVAVAGRVTGTLKSAFPDGKPNASETPDDGEDAPPDENQEEPVEEPASDHLAETKGPNTVIVIADVDMLSDGLSFQRAMGLLLPFSANPDFLVNAIDYLAGSTDLMSIRSRGTFARGFTVVEAIEREADMRTQDKAARINEDIQRFETELNGLRSQANEQNVGLLRGEALQKQRDLERQIRQKRRELDLVQQEKNQRIESLASTVQILNQFGVPLVVLIVGVLLAVAQRMKTTRTVHGGAG